MKPLKLILIPVMIVAALAALPLDVLAVGTVEGTVTEGNPASAPPLQGVGVVVMSRDEVTTYTTVFTDVNGYYSAPDIPAGDIRVYFRLLGYVEAFGDYTLPDGNTITANAVLAPEVVGGTGTIAGNIIDATQGPPNVPVDGASLTLYPNINQTSGAAAGTATTAPDGTFTIPNVPVGTYTLVATHALYSNDIYQVVSVDGSTMVYQDLPMSPQLASGQIRIVMSWGPNPTDLDSHLYTPNIGGSTYHIYYVTRGSLISNPYAELDRDDVTSYGPETVTIAQSFDGQYDYFVHNYSAQYGGGGARLSDSNCIVRIYDDSGLFATFNVPAASRLTDQYNWWVFSYNGTTGQVTARDTGPSMLGPVVPEGPGHSPCFIQTAAHKNKDTTWILRHLNKWFQ